MRAAICELVRFRRLLIVVVLSNVLGNFALSRGMREVGAIVSVSPVSYLRAVTNPWVITGICLLLVWLITQLSLLSRADLSFVLPITSLSYVLAAILGWAALNETVSPERWAGIGLITIGVSIVGRTAPRSTASEEVPQ
jgi:uncharacterized membrane protein